ncbi:hypothetical protein F4782DRAFT_535127 [Xylaria castorea]|nr:hypothetical protein F4782DRAFT_535127 [Xylaria castorea]
MTRRTASSSSTFSPLPLVSGRVNPASSFIPAVRTWRRPKKLEATGDGEGSELFAAAEIRAASSRQEKTEPAIPNVEWYTFKLEGPFLFLERESAANELGPRTMDAVILVVFLAFGAEDWLRRSMGTSGEGFRDWRRRSRRVIVYGSELNENMKDESRSREASKDQRHNVRNGGAGAGAAVIARGAGVSVSVSVSTSVAGGTYADAYR